MGVNVQLLATTGVNVQLPTAVGAGKSAACSPSPSTVPADWKPAPHHDGWTSFAGARFGRIYDEAQIFSSYSHSDIAASNLVNR